MGVYFCFDCLCCIIDKRFHPVVDSRVLFVCILQSNSCDASHASVRVVWQSVSFFLSLIHYHFIHWSTAVNSNIMQNTVDKRRNTSRGDLKWWYPSFVAKHYSYEKPSGKGDSLQTKLGWRKKKVRPWSYNKQIKTNSCHRCCRT